MSIGTLFYLPNQHCPGRYYETGVLCSANLLLYPTAAG